ncbi:1-phosphofructokinase [Actinophytocola algeriensis]|uniref:1-phosphofructokinase n=1 Tax=Actinophytocola algeriensis TaxID=1768010 RepID=A0A7W7PZW3_9PSEU|nr:1-phosphofructokinase [Actinophytocola algeriensis]MBB4904389.1 1-phosphofructokinase [Actinophytocola algeriensis]MBE1476753.1 1-phosphofructokinase [Actinophytocola algeriensis]
MILTLTLNPSLDRTIEVPELVRGAMVRASGTRLDPGGKGVNVARALAAHKLPTCAVVPRGGPEGRQLCELLEEEGIDVCAVPVTGHTRSNVSLVEPDGEVTKINEPGGELVRDDMERIVKAVLDTAVAADWVVASGSLPPGVPDTFYRDLGARLTERGIRFVVDTSGPALTAALAARPTLVKPNREELAESVGFGIDTLADVVRAAEVLRGKGAETVLASLGADGAVLVDGQGVRYGESPVDRGRSAVGAGDAMLAGYLAGGVTGGDALVEALSWGAAAVRLPGSRMPGPGDVDRDSVRVHASADLSRALDGGQHTAQQKLERIQ